MNLLWLEDFLALAATGSFSRAAEERNVTQPAFSRRIRSLEVWIGAELFDRSSHPVTVTDTGEWFRSVAHQLLRHVARLPEEARAVAEAGSGTLRLAATHALSFTFLPAWLRTLESGVALGPVQLVSDVMQQCESLMMSERVHLLICHWHPEVPNRLDALGHLSVTVGNDTLIPVSASSENGRPVHELSSEAARNAFPVLAYSAESGLGKILRGIPGYRYPRTEAVFVAHLASVLKTMALDGRGVAWLPESLIADEIKSGRLVQVGDPGWTVPIQIRLFRTKALLPPFAEALWQVASHRPKQ